MDGTGKAMWSHRLLGLLILLAGQSVCAEGCQLTGRTVFKNGVIYTVNSNVPNWHLNPEEAMVVENCKILFVGSNTEAEQYELSGAGNKVINLRWKTVLPGFHDIHMHPMEASNDVGGTCELPGDTLPNQPQLLDAFDRQHCQDNQLGTDWVLGHGHSIWAILDYIKSNSKTPREILDEHVIDPSGRRLPAIMMEETSHSVWVNSKALEMAGIDETVRDEHGSFYMRNSSGHLNGILLENAGIAIMEKALDPKNYSDLADLNYQAVLYGLQTLAQNGITSAVDARVYWGREHEKAWLRALDNGELTAKIILSLWAYPERNDNEQINRLKALYQNDPNSRLRLSQIKVYMDGLLDSRTAGVLPPGYLNNDIDLGLGNDGVRYFDKDRLAHYLTELQNVRNGEGFDFLIHVIGDAAVREALDAIEQSPSNQAVAPRHKLTHNELVDEADRGRFAQLGVIADFQVAGTFALPTSQAFQGIRDLIGNSRAAGFAPVRSLSEAGADVTLSSDWDVSGINPFVGLSHAINRGAESVDLKTALEMYTINSAYAMRQDETTGSLEAGKDADFVIVNEDIFMLEYYENYNQIKRTKVLYTAVQGQGVWIDPQANLGSLS